MRCPKCNAESGNDWSQCEGSCPMPGSPHYAEEASHAEETQRGEEGSPLAEIPAQSGAGQAQEGVKGGVPQDVISLEMCSKLRLTARWIIDQIDAFDRRTNGVGTDTGEAWELFDEIRMQLRMRLEKPSAPSSCMCGAGEEPCPGDDGRPLCAPAEEKV